MRWNSYSVLLILVTISSRLALSQGFAIYKIQSDGSGQKQVTSLPEVIRLNGLALSPDSTHIAWGMTVVKNGVRDAGVYVVGSNGKDLHELPLPPGILGLSNPAFSQDGKKLLVSELDSRGHQTISLENLDGSNRTLVVTDGISPNFNGDGSKIVFNRESLGSSVSEIVICDSDGKNEHILATDALKGGLAGPMFNPADSNQVIYRADRKGQIILASINIKSGAIADAIPSSPPGYVAMSTNGKLAVYERSIPNHNRPSLFLAELGATDGTPITHDDSVAFSYPQLSLDGKIIICFEYRGSQASLD